MCWPLLYLSWLSFFSRLSARYPPRLSGYPSRKGLKWTTESFPKLRAQRAVKLIFLHNRGYAREVPVCNDHFSCLTCNGGIKPYQEGTLYARMKISPQCFAQAPSKYIFPESPWGGLSASYLLTSLGHPSVAYCSVKASAIVIFGLSPPPSQLLRSVQ